jgi:predicted nucleic acid-binding protein
VGLEPVAAPYDGKVFIGDTSAWARSVHPRVRTEWAAAVSNGQIATTPMVAIEILRSARDGQDFDDRAEDLAALRDVPITRSVTNAAIQAFRELAHRQPLLHRSVTNEDLLIAAAAQDAAVGVLHYDADFDRLATVLEFKSRWIAPAGSL